MTKFLKVSSIIFLSLATLICALLFFDRFSISTLLCLLATDAFTTSLPSSSSKQLEKAYSKDEILEMYLNTIYFGHNCYGLQSTITALSVSNEKFSIVFCNSVFR